MLPLFNLFSSLISYGDTKKSPPLVAFHLAVNTSLCRRQGRTRPFEDHPLHALSSGPSQVSSLHKHRKLDGMGFSVRTWSCFRTMHVLATSTPYMLHLPNPLPAIIKVCDNRFLTASSFHLLKSVSVCSHLSLPPALPTVPSSSLVTMLSILGLALAALPLFANAQDSSEQGQSTVMSITMQPASSSVGKSITTISHQKDGN